VLGAVLLVVFVRPVWRLWAAFLLLFLCVQGWWLGIEPSNDREWLSDVSRLPQATFDGGG